MAHEAGHLVLHRATAGDVATIEDLADAFASEFFAPRGRDAMRRETPNRSHYQPLRSQKPLGHFDAIDRHGSARVADDHHEPTEVHVSADERKGWRKSEPVPIPQEKPRLLAKLAESIYGDPIDHAKLANDIGVPARLIKTIIAAHATRSEVALTAQEPELIHSRVNFKE